MSVVIKSDSISSKEYLPISVQKTLKNNNIEIFHGEIESEKIPIKFIK